jgi:hypothetical protein
VTCTSLLVCSGLMIVPGRVVLVLHLEGSWSTEVRQSSYQSLVMGGFVYHSNVPLCKSLVLYVVLLFVLCVEILVTPMYVATPVCSALC